MALYYEVQEYNHHGYERLVVSVYEQEDTLPCYSMNDRFTVRWQAGHDGKGFDGWYGFQLEIPSGHDLETMGKALTLARRIERKVGRFTFGTPPREFLAAMDKVGARVVKDGRIDRYMLVEDVRPAEYDAWADDYTAYGYRNVGVRIMARNEREAKIETLRSMTDYIARSPWDKYAPERLARWLEAGQPVLNLTTNRSHLGYNWYKAPDIRPIEEMLAPGERDVKANEIEAA